MEDYRTTPDLVRGILADTELIDAQLETYISAANTFINETIAGKGLKACTLEEIERWVAAHLISVTKERFAKKEGAGGAYIEYAGNFGEGLKGTSYGQMAILMDTTGTLAALGGKHIKLIAIKEY